MRIKTKSALGGGGTMAACAWQDERRMRKDCEEAFTAADEEKKGYLNPEDYKVAILSLFGYKPSKYEVTSVWRENCVNSGLAKDRFVSLAVQRMNQQDKDGMARQIFLAFDVHCQGFLTEKECLRAFQSVAPNLAKSRVPAVFREVDQNGDGRVSYRDFQLMMTQS